MPDSARLMVGKVCLVTGATSGIGEVTARELAGRGATVVIAGRSQDRCAATVGRIRQETGNSAVDFLLADLSDQAEARRMVREFLDRYPRLDVLVNNAGALFTRRQESRDGIEMTLALNHLGYVLPTCLLLERIQSSAPARIINVSSDAHRLVRGIDFDDIQGRRRYGGFRAYGQSKLANVMFTYELARRLAGTGVTVNALHPGVVATRFGANNGPVARLLRPVFNLVSINVERGARTSVYLATSPDVSGVTGGYFEKERPASSSSSSRDEAAARRLWDVSLAMTGLPPAPDRPE